MWVQISHLGSFNYENFFIFSAFFYSSFLKALFTNKCVFHMYPDKKRNLNIELDKLINKSTF